MMQQGHKSLLGGRLETIGLISGACYFINDVKQTWGGAQFNAAKILVQLLLIPEMFQNLKLAEYQWAI